MAKRRSSPRKAAPKSTKIRGTVKAAKPAKAAQVSARPAKKRAGTLPRCTARRQRATATDSYLATLDGWRKQFAARLRKTLREKTRREQFNRVADFCKKELQALSALAARLDRLANPPEPSASPAKTSKCKSS